MANRREVNDIIQGVIGNLFAHANLGIGEESVCPQGYRYPRDVATHIVVALEQAGFKVVRKPQPRS